MAWTDKCNFQFPENWEEWEKTIDRPIINPLGLPEFLDITTTAFGPTRGIEILPKWKMPESIVISVAVVGAFFGKRQNPNIPLTVEQICASAEECIHAGASSIHIHVRDDEGRPTSDVTKYHAVLDPLRKKYPNVVLDGCCTRGKTFQEVLKPVEDGLLEITPVNTTGGHSGDLMRIFPPSFLMAETEYIQQQKCKPQIAVYTPGDIDNADRYLIKTGILEKPYYWIVLAGMPGWMPMSNPQAMMTNLISYFERIKEIDPDSIIMVGCCGRASFYLVTAALLLGAHAIRVGMEDTIYRYPHRDDRIKSNAEEFKRSKQLVELLGRRCATADDYRKLVGIKK
jgi:3-keto-5-aminohexanoate cleavage enzyme